MQSSPTGIATGGGNSTKKRDERGMFLFFVFSSSCLKSVKNFPDVGPVYLIMTTLDAVTPKSGSRRRMCPAIKKRDSSL